jgi:hypothetical protein
MEKELKSGFNQIDQSKSKNRDRMFTAEMKKKRS